MHKIEQILAAIVESKFRFFKIKIEFVFRYAIVFSHFSFDERPERFDAVDMVMVSDKFFGMVDSVMLVAGEHQTVITLPFVGVDIRPGFTNKASNNGH